jgi:hypothetical protein
MKHNVMLTVASLLSIVLMSIHLADDIARGMEKGGASNLIAVPILVTWLYGTLVLTGRRSGYAIIFLGPLLGSFVPVVTLQGVGVCCRRRNRERQRCPLFRLDASSRSA